MNGKIAVEEHFVTPELKDTIFGRSAGSRRSGRRWPTLCRSRSSAARRHGRGRDRDRRRLARRLRHPGRRRAGATRVEQARRANDALAELVRAHPDRFVGLAALALQDPAAAADELERCVRELGFRGALVNGYSSARRPRDRRATTTKTTYLPFWERVAALGVPFYLHPRNPLPDQRRIYEGREALLGPTWAFTVETGTHCLRMMVSGLFDRFPRADDVIGHMGELLPFAVERTEQRLSHIPQVNAGAAAHAGLAGELLRHDQRQLPHAVAARGSCSSAPTASSSPPTTRSSGPQTAAEWFDAVPISARPAEDRPRQRAAPLRPLIHIDRGRALLPSQRHDKE